MIERNEIGFRLDEACPLMRELDMLQPFESIKRMKRRGEWQCTHCNKLFRGEDYVSSASARPTTIAPLALAMFPSSRAACTAGMSMQNWSQGLMMAEQPGLVEGSMSNSGCGFFQKTRGLAARVRGGSLVE